MFNPVRDPVQLLVDAVDFYHRDDEVVMRLVTELGSYEMSLLPSQGCALADSLCASSMEVMQSTKRRRR